MWAPKCAHIIQEGERRALKRSRLTFIQRFFMVSVLIPKTTDDFGISVNS